MCLLLFEMSKVSAGEAACNTVTVVVVAAAPAADV